MGGCPISPREMQEGRFHSRVSPNTLVALVAQRVFLLARSSCFKRRTRVSAISTPSSRSPGIRVQSLLLSSSGTTDPGQNAQLPVGQVRTCLLGSKLLSRRPDQKQQLSRCKSNWTGSCMGQCRKPGGGVEGAQRSQHPPLQMLF